MVVFIKDNGKMGNNFIYKIVYDMGKENKYGKMDLYMKVVGGIM